MIKDLLNQRFSRLLVVEKLPSKNGRTLWKCLCDCGNEKEVSGKHLLSESTKSCGCFRSDNSSALRTNSAILFKDRLLLMPSGCLEWQGSRDKSGYGTFRSGKRDYKAHRFAYEKAFGIIPKGIVICHTCDNPPCCNPDHLFAGTTKDNSKDCVSKGRQAKGDKNGNSKLNDHVVRLIKEAHQKGYTQTKIAEIYATDQTNVSKIVRGTAWKHVK